ncbi:hypothetical protein [uncultured Amnibacterium sp.]|uniref:hypothetical protein n=1 Tax=uncultured Amnibacterium sp. TaxID=1631851 RepID=UPI0035CBB6AF
MQELRKPSRRTAVIVGAAGLALAGAVGVGTAAMADTAPTPSPSASATGAPAGPGRGPREHAPHIGGTVLTVAGSTVTVQDRDGFTRTIVLAGDVAVTEDGASAEASAITKGAHIEATGTVASDGTSLDATSVTIGEPAGPKGGPGRHGDGPRPDGRGPAGGSGPDGGNGPTGGPEQPSAAPSAAPSAGS